MANELLLIDSDVLIDFSRGIEETKGKLKKVETNYLLSISVITQLELMVGCENKSDFESLQKFLAKFATVHLNKMISEQAVELFEKYQLSHGVLIADMLIASTALIHKMPLISKNRKDFRFIEKFNLISYKI